MARITDPPPESVASDMAVLREALDSAIPPKRVDRNLLIATWNIRELSGFVPEWVCDTPKKWRSLESLLAIAEILSRFDLVAIQEVKGRAEALSPILAALGSHWALMLTDLNEGRKAGRERLGFVYDTRRVRPAGLAGELVLPPDFAERDDDLEITQFSRAPHAAGFEWLGRRMTIVGLHAVYGGREGLKVREMELRALARMLRLWVERDSPWERGLIVVGDANIDRERSAPYAAFTSTGLTIPEDLKRARRLVLDAKGERLYSQIAWFDDDSPNSSLPFTYRRGDSFDFGDVAMRSRELDRRELSRRISDHLPLWAEFEASFRVDAPTRVAESEPRITDPPPPEVVGELEELEAQLDRDVPPKRLDRNLLICTWNIRAFGGLTKKWRSTSGDSPTRDFHSVLAIATILRRFDVVAVQELKTQLDALQAVVELLGPEWSLMLCDVTKGDPGNDERIAFLFDTRKVSLSGLACELVVPQAWLDEIGELALDKQFARTPYAVGFRCLGKTFTLVALHVLWGKTVAARVPEVSAIARWLRAWAEDPNAWDHNLIVLGDTNITSRRSKLYKAFTSTGLHIPGEMPEFPRTITSKERTLYDQIAWFDGADGLPKLDLEYLSCGYFDFTETALRTRRLSREKLSHMLSDHYPLWVEFAVRRPGLTRHHRARL